jgi:hypothetical protein
MSCTTVTDCYYLAKVSLPGGAPATCGTYAGAALLLQRGPALLQTPGHTRRHTAADSLPRQPTAPAAAAAATMTALAARSINSAGHFLHGS